ncbi:methyltransferase family protein [Chloroflexota bacterium]
MELTPAFEIGLRNAWMFTIPYAYVHFGLSRLLVDGKSTIFMWPSYTKSEKIFLGILMVTFFGSWIYSIFLPLKLGAVWLYSGLPVYLIGLIFIIMALLTSSASPLEEPVTRGIYRISRHPMNFGLFLALIGMGLASASWIVLLCAILFLILQGTILEKAEERMCLEKFGSVYREYINRTPRWIGLPKGGSEG